MKKIEMNKTHSKKILPTTIVTAIIVLFAIAVMCTSASAATDDEINQAIDNGAAWLKAQDTTTMSIGQKGLVAYALLHAGVPETEIQSMINDIAASASTDIYNLSTQILALVSTGNPTHSGTINGAVSNLVANQYGTGGWGYGSAEPSGADNSHTHVALLALYVAAKAGYTVPAATWTQAASYLETEQQSDGGWEYWEGGGDPGWTPTGGSYGSMTAAGVMGLEMCGDMGATLTPGSVSAGIDWLSTTYTFNLPAPSTCSNPGANGLNFPGETWMHYFMWTVEEAMVVPTEKVYLTHSSGSPSYDWYYDGADFLVNSQIPALTPLQEYWSNPNEDYPYSGMVSDLDVTCFAMLFLEKVTAQVVPVYVDIKPGSCPNPLNLKSKGVLPVAVLGTEDFDVTMIDPLTILLSREGVEEGVAPIRSDYEDVATPFEGELCNCHDLNGDGYPDLTLKFETQVLVETLGLGEVAGETIPLTLTGNLRETANGTPIEGEDCVLVLDVR